MAILRIAKKQIKGLIIYGIFGLISAQGINRDHLHQLSLHARKRGRDSSGLVYHLGDSSIVKRADYDIKQLLRKQNHFHTRFLMGHVRLITNGVAVNQPVMHDGICVIH